MIWGTSNYVPKVPSRLPWKGSDSWSLDGALGPRGEVRIINDLELEASYLPSHKLVQRMSG